MEREPRKPISGYGRNFQRIDRPYYTWEIQAAEIWRRQRERVGQPIFTKPRKVIGGYFREPSRPLRPRKPIGGYFRKPQAA